MNNKLRKALRVSRKKWRRILSEATDAIEYAEYTKYAKEKDADYWNEKINELCGFCDEFLNVQYEDGRLADDSCLLCPVKENLGYVCFYSRKWKEFTVETTEEDAKEMSIWMLSVFDEIEEENTRKS